MSETEITAFMENAERKNSLSLGQTTSSAENTVEKIKVDKKPPKDEKKSSQIETCFQSKALVVYGASPHSKEPENEENLEMDLLFREPDDQFSDLSPSEDLKEEVAEGFNAFLSVISVITLKKM